MRTCPRLRFATGLAFCALLVLAPGLSPAQTPQFANPITINADQSITYNPTPKGDRISDFSTVGYNYGNTPLPDEAGGYQVPVVVTLSPQTGDQTDRIQAAIDFISAKPLVNGFRGALLLKAGQWDLYSVNKIAVKASGVVIRGEGENPFTGTRIYARGTTNENNSGNTLNSRLITFQGNGNTVNTTNRTLVDAVYIPSGTNVIPIAGHPFTVNQRIQIRWPGTVAWQKASFYNTGATADADPAITFNRVITAVTANSITLDAPITSPLDPAYARGYVVPVTAFNNITNVGVSNIYFESIKAGDTDENHLWNATCFTNVEDGFMHDCTARYFAYSIAYVNTSTRKITINRSQCYDGISILQGGRRYSFVLTGEMALVSNALTRYGRHSFVINWPAAPGPNVFVDGNSLNCYNESGSHAAWDNGGLWDNITVSNHAPGLQVKLERPSAYCVAWNCILDSMTFENMPLSPNWSLGCTTSKGAAVPWVNSTGQSASLLGKAEAWSNGTRMSVRSLYEKQVATRLAVAGNSYRYQASPPTRVPYPPIFRTPAQLYAPSGTAWSYQLPVSNIVSATTTPTYTVSGLPSGVTVNASTGLISGTLPTVATATNYPLSLSARNVDGTTTKAMTLTVRPAGSPKIPLTMSVEADLNRTTSLPISGTTALPVPMVPASRRLAPMIVRKAYTSDMNGSAYTAADVPVPVAAVLSLEGLTSPVTITYNGSTTLPTATGFYDVVATLDDPNYSATATGRLLITNGTAASVTLANTTAPTAASPVTATSSQPAITPVITYDGSPTFPTATGLYTAKAIVADAEYFGSGIALFGLAPQITLQPGSVTVNQGTSATFSVAATGIASTYQWRKGGVAIPGATGTIYTIASPQGLDSGSYDVVVTDQTGTTTSAPATLTVVVSPQIAQQPASLSVAQNASATFSVSATGGSLSYQWRKAGAPISGATSASYTLLSVSTTDAASYDVVVTNPLGNVTSTAATLTVVQPPQISQQPLSQTVNQGTTTSFTVSATGIGNTYQWRKATVAIPGANATSYTISSAQPTDAASYDLVVTNIAGNATSAAATLTVIVPPQITQQPLSQVVTLGGSTTFTVGATGISATYQWRKGGVPISGATGTSYTIASVQTGNAGFYDVVVTNPAGSVTSVVAALTPLNPSGIVKINNTTALDQGGSWTGGVVPGNYDTATWNGTYTSGSVSIGSGLSVARIQLLSPSAAITINSGTGPLILGGGGLDLSASPQNLTVNAPVTLGAHQSWTINTGRTLALTGAVGDSGAARVITLAGNGTATFSGNNTFSGGLVISPPDGGLPVYKFGGNNPSTIVTLTGGALPAPITANGRLNINAPLSSLGAISGTGASGLVVNSSTTSQNLTFAAGGSFSMFQVGADNARATLRQSGVGNVTFAFFGYNTAAPNSQHTFDGGTWILGQIGQNNTGAQASGTFTLTNSADVTISTQGAYAHGTWRVINGAMRFNSAISVLHGSATGTNTSLVLQVDNSGGGPGLLTATGSLTLADGGSMTNANSLTVGTGGTVSLAGGIILGSTTARTAETDTITLAGGKLLANGTVSASVATTGQTRTFNWTGGQLTAATITPSSGFATPATGGVSPTALVQTAGTLAPGDLGTPGRTTINGAYSLGANATLSLDIGGTTAATAYQGAASQFDNLTVTDTTTLGGNLSVSLVNNYTPANNATFTVVSSTGNLTGAFSNVAFGTRLLVADGQGSFLVNQSGNTVTLSGFLPVVVPPFVTPGVNSNGLDWTGSVAVAYDLDRALSASGPWIRIASGLTTTTFTDNNVVPGTQYYYRISGTDSLGRTTILTSGPPPTSPTGLAAIPGFTTNALSWNTVPGATGYRVKRALTDSGPFVQVTSLGSSATAYTDPALITGTTYYYIVTALNSSGESLPSAVVYGTPIAGTTTKANNTAALDIGSSWSTGAVPTIADTALWNGTYASGTVGIGTGLSVAQIRLTSPSQAVTINAGTGSLTLGAGGIDLSTSTQNLTVSAPVVLNDNQTWNVNTGRTLSLSGNITEADPETSLTKSGAGLLVLTASSNAWTGATLVTVGTLRLDAGAVIGPLSSVSVATGATLTGTGVIQSPVTVNGILAPGLNGAGTLSIQNTLALAATSATTLSIDRASPAACSAIAGTTAVTYGGNLTVTNAGAALVAGDRFVLFGGTVYSGSFATLSLPTLAAGLVWDTTGLPIDGSILVRTSGSAPVTRYWDTSATSGLQGGSGTWDAFNTATWNTAADGSGTPTKFWHFDSIVFQTGTVNTVTLSGPVAVTSLTQAGNGTATTLSGGTLVLGGSLSNGVPTGNATLSIQAPVRINNLPVTLTAAQPILFGQGLGGSGNITKTGNSTLTINGDSDWSGSLILDGGTTRFNGATTGLASLTYGAVAASSSNSTLQLTQDASLTSLVVQNLGTNTLDVAANATLTVTGPVILGLNGNGANITNTTTTSIAFTGGGSASFTNPGGNFIVAGGNKGGIVTADFSGLSALTIDSGPTGNAYLGVNLSTTSDTLRLAPNTTITAANFYVGDANTGGTYSLVLGSGDNVFNVDNLYVGQRPGANNRSDGSITFPVGSTNATLQLRAADGVSRANLQLDDNSSGTGRLLTTTFDVSGRSADILLNNLVVGRRNASSSPAQLTSDTFRWDRGTLDVLQPVVLSQAPAAAQKIHVGSMTLGSANSTTADTAILRGGIVVAENRSTVTTAGASAQATLTIGGGSVTSAGITLGDIVTLTAPTSGTRQSLAILNITGGSLTLTAALRSGTTGGPGNETSTLTLNGGTLDLGGNALGATGNAAITKLNFQSGTLANVASINGTAGLTKTGNGTLTLAGNNTFSGPITISNGTFTLSAGATATTSISVASGAILVPGGAITGNLTLPAGATWRVRLDSATAYDQLVLNGAKSTATLGGTLDLVVAPNLPAGTRFRILRNQGNPAAPVSGIFAGHANRTPFTASGRTWYLDYGVGSGGDVDLVLASTQELWRQSFFGTLFVTANSADTADPDADERPNLLEYAFGGNPLVADLPDPVAASNAQGFVQITFSCTRPDLVYLVQGSSDLTSWTDLATYRSDAGPVVTFTDPLGGPKRFLKVRVSVSP